MGDCLATIDMGQLVIASYLLTTYSTTQIHFLLQWMAAEIGLFSQIKAQDTDKHT